MKKKPALDVDFIGAGRLLTKEDKIAISEFIKARKQTSSKKKDRSVRSLRRKRVSA